MKMFTTAAFFAIILIGCSGATGSIDDPGPRQIENFDYDWRFHLGDVENAHEQSFDHSEWRTLDLPHDWSIEGNYDSANAAGIAGGFLPTGIGWYRKEFQWQPSWQDRKVFIEFDGVYMNSTVWINGRTLGSRPYGYIGFSYDLTPHLREGKNVIAVKVDHSKAPSGRWYTGSGIYRHVRLVATNKTYVPQWGTFIRSRIEGRKATISVNTELVNETATPLKIRVKQDLIDQEEQVRISTDTLITLPEGRSEIARQMILADPVLWSVGRPCVYRLKTEIYEGDFLIDRYLTTTGFRTIDMDPQTGVKLNGEKLILKGVSNHHDAGPVGAAVPEDVLYRRLKLLKEMGCNAIRTTHNPFAPEFYHMCDTMGFLVMDEAFDGWEQPKAKYDYGLYFEDWWEKDLTDFIKRDRNHPSVIFWSIGNEVKGFTNETQKKLVELVKSLDDTRPVTQGRGYMGKYTDIAGFNGHGENKGYLEKFHKNNPEKVLVGTEITHSYQTRGIYRTKTWYRSRDFIAPWENEKTWDKIKEDVYRIDDLADPEVFDGIDKNYQSSYDNSIVRMGVRDYWKATRDLPYFIGAFRWTGFDYLGESFGWPARTVSFGILDLAGFPTDNYYLYQSLWSSEPMAHLLPHWTHPGKEGVEIPVVVYTNAESAELFLNGRSLGEKKMTDDFQMVWKVAYQPGELKAVAKKNGKIVAQKSVRTAGVAEKIGITADKISIYANRMDVAHLEINILDGHGNEVPDASELLHFEIEGPAKFIGFENGDILDLSNAKVPERRTFSGKCLAMIQSDGTPGTIKVKVNSPNLEPEEILIKALTIEPESK